MQKEKSDLSMMDLTNIVDLYIRVSTIEQAQEGYSISEQEARLRAYCVAMNYQIHAVHIDPGYSGTTLERPGLKKIIKDVRSGRVKKIIVWKLDRLSRSQKDTMILLEDVFLKNDCNFISIMESFDTSTPFGRCIIGILAAFAQMERESIHTRLMMGKQARLKGGNFYGGPCPFGYKYKLQKNGKKELVVDEFTSQAVKDMYQLYASGQSIADIGRYMQKTYGLYTNRYPAEVATRCSLIMRNPVYCGKVRMNKLEYTGKHEALVSAELWQQVNERLAENLQHYKRIYSRSSGLLSGLLFCGDCGARMCMRDWGFKGKNKIKINKYVCYSVSKCNKQMIKNPNCTNKKKYFSVPELDAFVLEQIKKLSLDPDFLDTLMEENKQEMSIDLESFEERLTNIEKQISRLLNLYQTGVVDIEEIQKRLSVLKEERNVLQNSLEEAEAENSKKMSKKEAKETLASLSNIIETENSKALYVLVHNIIDKIVVLNGNVTIYWSFC